MSSPITPTFSDLKLIEPLLLALSKSNYTTPTPIQVEAIPHLLQGHDLLGCAQTGTGKTAAFALPILQRLSEKAIKGKPGRPRILILTPTRELAIQIDESFQTYGQFLKLKTAVIYGGVGQVPQVRRLASGVEVLVATPGRLLDLINQKYINLADIDVFVLDEADRMLDMGFIVPIRKILALLPSQRQNLFFSATMPDEIIRLASTMLKNPKRVEVTPVASTVELINQSVMYVDRDKKRDLLLDILKSESLSKVIVFTRTKHVANRVVETLRKKGIPSETIHGNKSQTARQSALLNFKEGRARVLVATDIAARGIDIDHISHVINYEIPNISESYVHRIGRTARAGASGIAISFCDTEEKAFLRDIEKLIGRPIPVNIAHSYHSEVVANGRILSKGKAKAAIENRQRGPRNPQGRRDHKSKSGAVTRSFRSGKRSST